MRIIMLAIVAILACGCLGRESVVGSSSRSASVPGSIVVPVQRSVLVLADETMRGKIDDLLADWRVATRADGLESEVVWCKRRAIRTPEWRAAVAEIAAITRSKQFDYLFIVGNVAQPLSGSRDSYWNGGHFFGATNADAVYAANQIPFDQWSSRDAMAVVNAGQPWAHNANRPDDGIFDVDHYVVGQWSEASVRQNAGISLTDRSLRPKPFARADAAQLGVFGISSEWTPEASDAEVAAIRAYLTRAIKWKMGRSPELPAVVLWDNALGFTDQYELRPAWSVYGAISIQWTAGDNSSGPTGRLNYRTPDAAAALSFTGGGPGSSGPYLNFGPWNSDPSRRVLDAQLIGQVPYRIQVWNLWGSYIHDLPAKGSLPRAALLKPDGECVFACPWFWRVSEAPNSQRRMGDIWIAYLNSIASNPSNGIQVASPQVGDPTLQSIRPSQPITTSDFNADGTTNFDDLIVLSSRYNSAGSLSQGDGNMDGQVNFDDLLILAAAYNGQLAK